MTLCELTYQKLLTLFRMSFQLLHFMCMVLILLRMYKFSHRITYPNKGKTCSSRREILYSVSQRSILGSLLLNIFLCDKFLCLEGTDVASCADYATTYNINLTWELVIKKLGLSSSILETNRLMYRYKQAIAFISSLKMYVNSSNFTLKTHF